MALSPATPLSMNRARKQWARLLASLGGAETPVAFPAQQVTAPLLGCRANPTILEFDTDALHTTLRFVFRVSVHAYTVERRNGEARTRTCTHLGRNAP